MRFASMRGIASRRCGAALPFLVDGARGVSPVEQQAAIFRRVLDQAVQADLLAALRCAGSSTLLMTQTMLAVAIGATTSTGVIE